MANMDKKAISRAYDDVRSDSTDTAWLVIKYNVVDLNVEATGTDYEDFLSHFTEDERAFGFVRVITGDEMSKRAKFVLITWIGNEVSPLKRAKMSTDKAFVKSIINNVAVEIQTSDFEELSESYIKETLLKAGGANYGTGI